MKFHEEGEEAEEEATMEVGVIIEAEEEILEVVEEDSVVEVAEGVIIVVAAVEGVETEENTGAEVVVEVAEGITEGVGEVDHQAEAVAIEKERDHLMVEGIDTRVEDHHHQPLHLAEKETIIGRKEGDLHREMGLLEDHLHLQGIVMVLHVEIMADRLLQALLEDPMREEDQVVEADMKTATLAEVLLHPQGIDTEVEVLWPAEILLLILVGQGLGKDILRAQAILAPVEAQELGEEIIEVVAQVMGEVEVTKIMKEVKEDTVEEVMNHPQEHLQERNTLSLGVIGVGTMTEEIEAPRDIIVKCRFKKRESIMNPIRFCQHIESEVLNVKTCQGFSSNRFKNL